MTKGRRPKIKCMKISLHQACDEQELKRPYVTICENISEKEIVASKFLKKMDLLTTHLLHSSSNTMD
jgi:hypothetical protein